MGNTGVRLLTSQEWAVFRRVRLRALADAPHAFGTTLREAQTRTEQDWRSGLRTRAQFLAVAGDADLGTVAGMPDPKRGGAHLISMWVAPEARGTGISDLLVCTVIAWATDTGHRSIWLEVAEGNAPAERLYARNGFVRTGVTGVVSLADPRPEFEMVRRW